jgi:hypothetical protein
MSNGGFVSIECPLLETPRKTMRRTFYTNGKYGGGILYGSLEAWIDYGGGTIHKHDTKTSPGAGKVRFRFIDAKVTNGSVVKLYYQGSEPASNGTPPPLQTDEVEIKIAATGYSCSSFVDTILDFLVWLLGR